MHILEIIRLETGIDGTFGVLKIDTKLFCCTLEPEEKLNKLNVSCIPARQYDLNIVQSTLPAVIRFGGVTYEIANVPNRGAIRFHPGNTNVDTFGCIILGQYVAKLRGLRAILNSGKSFVDFMIALNNDPVARLVIREMY